jgi:Glycosyltransferase family 87
MASKSKQKRMRKLTKKETATSSVLIAMGAAVFAIIQNRNGLLSDISQFYGLHFADGLHNWPFSYHTLLGSTVEQHPVEYPALAGLIMWLFSFLVLPSQLALSEYYRITAFFHIFVFGATAYYINKLGNRKLAVIFALSPAVLYSLNRNWDIWAIVTMLMAIYLFNKGKTQQSAIWLAISIAIKFFPLVILLPITIFYLRKKEIKQAVIYIAMTLGAWFIINLPFMLINFRGWSYFYEFSYKRSIGAASIFEVTQMLGFGIPTTKVAFYGLNLLALGLVVLYLVKSKKIVSVADGSFFTMFAFILFNKQYSMQYVIWLASLAVLAIFYLSKESQKKILIFYGIWQASELLFQYSFFQRILTGTFKGTATPASPEISDGFYATAGLVRYGLAIAFTLTLGLLLAKQRKDQYLVEMASSKKVS